MVCRSREGIKSRRWKKESPAERERGREEGERGWDRDRLRERAG